MPEYRVNELGPVKALISKSNYLQAELETSRAKMDTMARDMESLKAERLAYMEQVFSEEAAKRKVLETEMKRQYNDLTRLRGARDQLQMNLDAERNKNKTEDALHRDLELNAKVNREFAKVLLNNVKRLKTKIVAYSGDERLMADVLYAYELERQQFDESKILTEVPKIKTLVESLQQRVDQAEKKARTLKHDLDKALKVDSADERMVELRKSDAELRMSLAGLESQLERYQKVFGVLDDSGEATDDRDLVERLKDSQQKAADLELKVRFYQEVCSFGSVQFNLTLE